jgi:exo-beta-1,3-glucanase (GH17 family)
MNPLPLPLRLALALSFAFVLGACGGAAAESGPGAEAKPFALRPIDSAFFRRRAVAYSGYRGADHRTPPTPEQVLEDLRLLVQAGYGVIRLFDAQDADTGVVLRAIRVHQLDLKVQLGIWIAGPKATQDAANRAQIANGVALARAYPEIVLAVSVGNETMVDWSMHMPPSDIVAYVRSVRDAVEQPVTSDDNWAVFANRGGRYPGIDALLATIDFVSMHTYPLLDSVYDPGFVAWKHPELPQGQRTAAMMDTMIAKARADYAAVRAYLAAQGLAALPITIGETGWKAIGPQADRISPANQQLYKQRLDAWTDGPKQIFWFEAFDEPWKGEDDGWGLFDVQRVPRPVVQPLAGAAG